MADEALCLRRRNLPLEEEHHIPIALAILTLRYVREARTHTGLSTSESQEVSIMSDDISLRAIGNDTRPASRPRSVTSAGARRFGYLISIVVNLALLYLANGVPNWDVPFITNDWPDVLWAVNLSLGATIAANLAFMAYDPAWFRRIAQMVLAGISIVVFNTLRTVFPFDLSGPFEQALRLALLVGMFGLGIAVIVEFVGLVLGRER